MNSPSDTRDTTEAGTSAPRTWLVLGEKKGDNGQVYTVADALGWHCELKKIQVLEPYVFGKPKVAPTLYHIDREKSDELTPPWPDLIITVGRRPANVALWIREQSGRRTKIVLLGKPSGLMDEFDLIVASGENQFPPLKNVLPISLPLMRVDVAGVAAAVDAWKDRLAAAPRPLIGMMVGGPTGPFVFDKTVTNRLVAVANEIAQSGGTPYVTTSRRTPGAVVTDLKSQLPSEARFFEWKADAENNPYLGLLGLADGFIVTGDSISMMVEVVRLRKPLAILSLPTSILGSMDQARRSLARILFAPAGNSLVGRVRALLAHTVYKTGFITHTRDFRAFHQMLIDQGLAVWAGQGFPAPSGEVPDDAGIVARRIKDLMGVAEG